MKIKLSAPHRHLGFGVGIHEHIIDGMVLSADFCLSECDTMIGFWEFTEEFIAFRKPKVFYCCEPSSYFRGIRRSKQAMRMRIQVLRTDEFAWHNHAELQMRVNHHTGHGVEVALGGNRRRKAAAVLGNLGHPMNRNRGRQRRIDFILDSGCDIYGSESSWIGFRRRPWSHKATPASYQGISENKLLTLSKYHSCLCFENTNEPLYFTEKFPDAVRAGCVPVYHAHPSVREAFLAGAIWIDPADYKWDVNATMEAAYDADRSEVASANQRWLQSNPRLKETLLASVYSRLAMILNDKCSGKLNISRPAFRPHLTDEY